jgi:hypothetical protein
MVVAGLAVQLLRPGVGKGQNQRQERHCKTGEISHSFDLPGPNAKLAKLEVQFKRLTSLSCPCSVSSTTSLVNCSA